MDHHLCIEICTIHYIGDINDHPIIIERSIMSRVILPNRKCYHKSSELQPQIVHSERKIGTHFSTKSSYR